MKMLIESLFVFLTQLIIKTKALNDWENITKLFFLHLHILKRTLQAQNPDKVETQLVH